jgi:hypothetical protein
MADWRAECVLCAARGKRTRLEVGHVCVPCLTRIGDNLSAIVELAANASVEPITGRGQGRSVPASKPPINCDGVDPALTMVTDCATVLDICEAWERLVRESRGMAPYGPASHARAITAHAGQNDTGVTLTGCTGFLRASLPWWAESPDQPIEDFASEIAACRRALSRWDPMREPTHHGLRCPTETEHGTCGYFIRWEDGSTSADCPRCHRTWTVEWLMLVAADQDNWIDAQALAILSNVHEQTIRRWARNGKVGRRGMLYSVKDVATMRGAG